MPDPVQSPDVIKRLLAELFKDVAGQTGSTDFDLPPGFGQQQQQQQFPQSGQLPGSFGDATLESPKNTFEFNDAFKSANELGSAFSGGQGPAEGNPYAAAFRGILPLLGGIDDKDKVKSIQGFQSVIPALGAVRGAVDRLGLNNANVNLFDTIRFQRQNAINDARTDVVVDAFSTVSGKKTGDFSDTERGNIDAFAKLLNTKFPDLTPAQVRAAATRYFNNPRNATTTDSKNTLKETDLKTVLKPGEDVKIKAMGDQSINPRTGLPFGEGGTAQNFFNTSANSLQTPKSQILKNAGISTKDSSGFHQGNALKILNKIQPEAAATGTGSQTNPLFLQAISKLFSGADEDSKTRSVLSQAFGSNPDFNFLNQG